MTERRGISASATSETAPISHGARVKRVRLNPSSGKIHGLGHGGRFESRDSLFSYITPADATGVELISESPRHLREDVDPFVLGIGNPLANMTWTIISVGEESSPDFGSPQDDPAAEWLPIRGVDFVLDPHKAKQIKDQLDPLSEGFRKETFAGWRRIVLELPGHLCREIREMSEAKSLDPGTVVRDILRMHFSEGRAAPLEADATRQQYDSEYEAMPPEDFPASRISRRAIVED